MIALGCDHGGYELKQEIIKYLEEKQIAYKDFGCDSTEAVDYPIYARKVGTAIQNGECDKGILKNLLTRIISILSKSFIILIKRLLVKKRKHPN